VTIPPGASSFAFWVTQQVLAGKKVPHDIRMPVLEVKPDELDAEKRPYLPKVPGILGATHLLATGEHETLKLTAPTKVGDYEYVCTFPGHYQVMWGRLVVTKDVDSYLAANPQPVIPSAPSDEAAGVTAAGHHDHAH